MKVLFFAHAREAAGRADYLLEVSRPITATEFWALLVKPFPKLVPYQKSARLARHESYLQEDDLLDPADEIAVIPPVSGG
jgi:molybdopterin converting factor subunit 1